MLIMYKEIDKMVKIKRVKIKRVVILLIITLLPILILLSIFQGLAIPCSDCKKIANLNQTSNYVTFSLTKGVSHCLCLEIPDVQMKHNGAFFPYPVSGICKVKGEGVSDEFKFTVDTYNTGHPTTYTARMGWPERYGYILDTYGKTRKFADMKTKCDMTIIFDDPLLKDKKIALWLSRMFTRGDIKRLAK